MIQDLQSMSSRRQLSAKETLQQISQNDLDYEGFLKEQTNQLKKLFRNVRTNQNKSALSNRPTPRLLPKKQCRCPIIVGDSLIETIDLSDLKRMLTGNENGRVSQQKKMRMTSEFKNKWIRQGKALDFYSRRRKQIEKELFVGGRGYQSARNSIRQERGQSPRRLHEFRDVQSRIRLAYRRFNIDKSTL